MGWLHNSRDLLERVAKARAAEQAAIEQITLSTLPDAPWPCEQISIVFGEVAANTESALRWLRIAAHRIGADAVIGVEVQRCAEQGYSRSGRPRRGPSADARVRGPQYLATGTAVRKSAGSVDARPDGSQTPA
jgi:uncharacterized protein YbjQ (UPF0145 family)